ncbi:MAG: hypothetical protein BWY90_01575 [Deltaproteobacteria bacterium ADurb.BinA014]|nr:MAG: hypothetical protein BWY90_01575 [Deltaproteobacteria bacterium ADurb.BinA014]
MTIPAGHINPVEAGHVFGFDDNVFQNFIECRAQVNIAVGIRRPVVQNKRFGPFHLFSYLVINACFLPYFEHFRFPLG